MEIPCVQCGQRLRVPDELRTVRIRCPACQYIFTTSTSDADVVTAEFAPNDAYSSRDTGSISNNSADYNVQEYLVTSTEAIRETIQKGAKTGWSVLFFIILTLLFKGHNIVNFFKAKKKQPQPAVVRPANNNVGEEKKLGDVLPPPKKPSRSKRQRPAPKEAIPAEKPTENHAPAETPAERNPS